MKTRTLMYALGMCLILIIVRCLAYPAGTPHAASQSATVQVETLGNPFTKGLYARNVWDMQLFNGRIYLGHGNSSNFGPDPNVGPIPVWYYDLATGTFVNEFTVDEEQIDIYRILDGKVYIPGHDPRNTSGNGDVYRLEPTGWAKFSTIPSVYHTYDIALFRGNLFVGNGPDPQNSVMMSSDNGKTWKSVLVNGNRTYSLFQFHNRLYAMQWIKNTSDPTDTMLYVLDDDQFVNANVAGNKLLPNTDLFAIRMVRINEFQRQLVYIASDDGVNDHQWDSHGLYVASAIDKGRRVTLPEPNALPYDVLIRGNTLYVLTAIKQSDIQYTIVVYKTTDLSTWSEVLRFDTATFARSFEEANGAFYFGLGSNDDMVSSANGTILRVKPGSQPASTPTRTPTPMVSPTLTPTAGTAVIQPSDQSTPMSTSTPTTSGTGTSVLKTTIAGTMTDTPTPTSMSMPTATQDNPNTSTPATSGTSISAIEATMTPVTMVTTPAIPFACTSVNITNILVVEVTNVPDQCYKIFIPTVLLDFGKTSFQLTKRISYAAQQ